MFPKPARRDAPERREKSQQKMEAPKPKKGRGKMGGKPRGKIQENPWYNLPKETEVPGGRSLRGGATNFIEPATTGGEHRQKKKTPVETIDVQKEACGGEVNN